MSNKLRMLHISEHNHLKQRSSSEEKVWSFTGDFRTQGKILSGMYVNWIKLAKDSK